MEETVLIPWDESRLGWLTLAWFDGFGARTLRRLRQRFGNDGARAIQATRQDVLACGVSEKVTQRFLSWRNVIDPAMFARRCEAEAIRFVLDEDEEFPSYLKHSSDPPAALFLRGAKLAPQRPIAIVGTRAMTSYGARVTEQLSRELSLAGCEIISGLALGIDGRAHQGALEVGGKTIAVLPGGNNNEAIYPRQHAPLAKRLLEHQGTLITEWPPGTESFKHLFPLRNRLIASLCVATVIVEAAESSGSLITAKLALEENRDVFAVPGPITSEQSTGTNRLLKAGAIPCLGAEDILSLFDIGQAPLLPVDLTTDERELLELLDRPLHIDELIRALEGPAASTTAQCSQLELKGLIEQQGGGIYSRTKLGKQSLD